MDGETGGWEGIETRVRAGGRIRSEDGRHDHIKGSVNEWNRQSSVS